MPPRRFKPPWSMEERQESFIVTDANGASTLPIFISRMSHNGKYR
jgi:hypothetical protein